MADPIIAPQKQYHRFALGSIDLQPLWKGLVLKHTSYSSCNHRQMSQ
jgi:hypothetical protein